MKRHHSPQAIACITLLAAAVLAASCTKDYKNNIHGSGSDHNSRTPVLFTAAIQTTATPDATPYGTNAATTATRTAPGADGAQTVWTADDRIAVFMLPKGGKIPADTLPAAHNVPYSIDPATGVMTQAVPQVYDPETNTTSPGVLVPMYYPSGDDEVDFVAYYPYNAILEVDDPRAPTPYIHGTVLRDQTTPEKQFHHDYLFSDNARGISRSKDAVALRFRHLNAKLRLDITLSEGLAGGKVTEVKLSGIPSGVLFDMRDGSINTIFPPTSIPISCLPLPSPTAGTGAAATFTALVPPHSGADYPGRQITVTVDGEEYTGLLPDTDDYAGNTMYAYPARVTPRGLTIDAPAGEVPWTDAQALPEGYDLTVANETELRRFAELVNAGGKLPNGTLAADAKVLQTADITLTQGEWTPIGNSDRKRFRGAYNGDGHTITGLTITTVTPDAMGYASTGLFGVAQTAVLTGIHLREVQINIQAGSDVTQSLDVGSIGGNIMNSTLSLCSVAGKVNVGSDARNVYTGGIAGLNNSTTISRCRAGVETTAATTRAGGGSAYAGEIAGINRKGGFILSCETLGKPVTAEASRNSAYAGGITGQNEENALIAFCRTGANAVTAQNGTTTNYAGGLVGLNRGFLYSCYSRATAVARGGSGNNNYAGAIIGYTEHILSIGDIASCCGTGATGQGTSNLDGLYIASPGPDVIYDKMRNYVRMVESIHSATAYPFATRHTPAAYPAHGITPVRVKWGPGEEVWQRGTNTAYPEIDMEYDGEDNAVAP